VAPSQLLEITVTTASFNVPVGLEVSGSGRFVWARATLGDVGLTGEQALQALQLARRLVAQLAQILSAYCSHTPLTVTLRHTTA
jgi:hypothetical protein